MKRAKATGIAVALLLLTGSATRAQEPALATKLKDVVGTWRTVVSPLPREHFLQFTQGRTYKIAHYVKDLETAPEHAGEFWFKGSHLFIKRTASVGRECIDQTGTYEVQLLANDNLKFKEIRDECFIRNHFRAEEYEAVQ